MFEDVQLGCPALFISFPTSYKISEQYSIKITNCQNPHGHEICWSPYILIFDNISYSVSNNSCQQKAEMKRYMGISVKSDYSHTTTEKTARNFSDGLCFLPLHIFKRTILQGHFPVSNLPVIWNKEKFKIRVQHNHPLHRTKSIKQ